MSEPRQILIIGGHGQMGRLLQRTFESLGLAVHASEAQDEADRPRAIQAADVILVAVPMDRAARITAEVAPHVRPDALLCDINSLKKEVCAAMEARCGGEALGMHPMFGPTVGTLRQQKVVLCPVREGPRAAWLRETLIRLGCELIETDPDTHDRLMAVVQVLVHFQSVVMGEALRRAGIPVSESLRFTSPIYLLELAVVGRLFAQDPELYAEIEMQNPYSAEMRRHFLEAAGAVDHLVGHGDRAGFQALFSEVNRYFGGFSKEAMDLSDFLIDRLVERG